MGLGYNSPLERESVHNEINGSKKNELMSGMEEAAVDYY